MTDRELLGRIDERLKALQENVHLIHTEVKKTNGRVTSLEGWRNQISGGFKASTVIYSILSSLFGAGVGFITTYLIN